jgi:hypothetical protein
MRDRSGTMLVSVMTLRMLVSLIVAVVCVAMWCRRVAAQRFWRRAAMATWMWRGGLCRRPAAMRDRSEAMSVAVMMLRVAVLLSLTVVCVAMWCCRVAAQRCCQRASTVTSMLRGGLCRRPAAIRDRSEIKSDAVMMMLRVVYSHCGMLADGLSQLGNSALLSACLGGRIDVARWLVSEAGSDARSERNNVGRCGDAACDCVVDCDCGVRDVLSQRGNTALLLACLSGRIDLVRWLVFEAGSDARSERNEVGRLMTLRVVVSLIVTLAYAMCCRSAVTQRFCWRA